MMTTEEYNDKPTGSCDGRSDLVSMLASLDVPLLQQPGPFTETRAAIREAAARIRQLEADARESALQYLADAGQMADKVGALTAELARVKAAGESLAEAAQAASDDLTEWLRVAMNDGYDEIKTNEVQDALDLAIDAWAAAKDAGNE
jgi:hypothetical protein